MLKASQKRTKRAALTEALMSSAPAITFGWLATTPTGCPSRRAKPTTMFIAKYCWTSKKSPLSTTIRTTSLMSYDSFDESGMIVARPGSARSGSSVGGKRGGCWSQLCGTKLSRRRTWAKHSSSDSARKCPTPDLTLWTSAPPSESKVTSSPVVTRMTSGPVMNMYPTPCTMKVKSVIAGE